MADVIYKLQRLDNYMWHSGSNKWVYFEDEAKPYKRKNHATSVIKYFGYNRRVIPFMLHTYELKKVNTETLNVIDPNKQ